MTRIEAKQSKKKTLPARSKATYRIRNWREYDRSLVQRGSLTVWIDKQALRHWRYEGPPQQGAPFEYSDLAIKSMLSLRELFHLPNRAVEGFVRSLFERLGICLPVPHHTTLSRRGKRVAVRLPKRARGPLHLVIDSSGLKVHGEGEWKVRQQGYSKRRTWRKMHLTVDAQSREIQAAVLTEAGVTDAEAVPAMVEQVDFPLASASADGAYDKKDVYESLSAHSPGVQINIPPRKDAKIRQHGNRKQLPLAPDETLRQIRRLGRKGWKKQCGYHRRRSLAETAMFRMKTLFGERLRARRLDTQTTEFGVRCYLLNRMTHLGMPASYRIA